MSKLLYLCDDSGFVCNMGVADPGPGPMTTLGQIAPADLVASTPASLLVDGADSDGDVLVAAFHGGLAGDQISVEFLDAVLGVSVTAKKVSVSRQAGDTGQAVADAINADLDASALVVASVPGSGLSDSGLLAEANLTGGADDGHQIKFSGHTPVARRITRIEDV